MRSPALQTSRWRKPCRVCNRYQETFASKNFGLSFFRWSLFKQQHEQAELFDDASLNVLVHLRVTGTLRLNFRSPKSQLLVKVVQFEKFFNQLINGFEVKFFQFFY